MILLRVGQKVCFSALKDVVYEIPLLPHLCSIYVAIVSLCWCHLSHLRLLWKLSFCVLVSLVTFTSGS